jgi:PAS domain S-box-containing protein
MPIGSDPDGLPLKKVLRDLVALTAVASVWVGRKPQAIATDLADRLATLLNLEFAFVCLRDSDGSAAAKISRGTAPPADLERLQQYLDRRLRLSHPEIFPGADAGNGVQGGGIVLPLGVNAEFGLVVAACDRPDFPSEIEQLLLSLVACHSATAFKMARLNEQLQRAETALAASERQKREAGDEFETKLAERTAELRRSETYLAEAERLSHTGTWAVNLKGEGTIVYASEESYRIYGLDPRQGVPKHDAVWQRVHPDDRTRLYEEIQEGERQKRDYLVEFRVLLPDGTVKYVEEIGHHVFSERGELLERMGIDVDVTERKRALEARERLRQLESDLAHVNRLSMMGVLAASLAHEVKQPIATARNNARAALNFLARRPPDLGEVREALGCIVGDADRAGDIIDRIRAHTKKAPLRKDRFDLNEAVTEVVDLARSEITKNEVSVRTRLAQGVAPVQGDRVQLQQVVLNLILNAVEAMISVDGPRELLISTEQRQTNGVVTVCDSGPGIDPEQLERVFEAFYTTKFNGVGIGLSICRSIIDAHGGRLWIEANEPRGAAFQFTVPSMANRLKSLPRSLHQTREPREDSVLVACNIHL